MKKRSSRITIYRLSDDIYKKKTIDNENLIIRDEGSPLIMNQLNFHFVILV